MIITNELLYNQWKQEYELKNLTLSSQWSKKSEEVFLKRQDNTSTLTIFNKENFLTFSEKDAQDFFGALHGIANREYEECYLIIKSTLETLNAKTFQNTTGVHLWFNSIELDFEWTNGSGVQSYSYPF